MNRSLKGSGFCSATEEPDSSPPKKPATPVPPLELAFIRWSVVHRQWHEHSGSMPSIEGFLAGWFCRICEAEEPVVDRFRDSFRCGWKEAHDQIVIMSRQEKR